MTMPAPGRTPLVSVVLVHHDRPELLKQAIASLDAADTLLKSSAIGDRKVSTSRWLERLLLSLASGQALRLPSRPHIFDTLA